MRESLEGVGVGNPYERTDELTDGDLPSKGEISGSVRNAREPYYSDDSVTVWHGDCLDVLRSLPDNSVDSVVTDPPYDLTAGKKGGTGPASVTLDNPYGRARITAGFMGKAWDGTGIAFKPELWVEALRVLKPGGHLLAFGGSRTWHRLACAVEDAGFEVRDSIAWLYGSGFPKSLDVSKAIDKGHGLTAVRAREFQMWLRQHVTPRQVNEATGTDMGHHWTTHPTQPSVATADLFDKLRPLLPEVPEDIERLVAERTGIEWADYVKREVVGIDRRMNEPSGVVNIGQGERTPVERKISNAHTPEAARWQGWGTALKPAFEPIVVARKPLAGTVAANVQQFGTGALNVDRCRVETNGERFGGGAKGSSGFVDGYGKGSGFVTSTAGRWPTNVVLDDSQAAALDAEVGTLKSGANPTRRSSDKFRDAYGDFRGQEECTPARGADEGGPSRFFPTFKYAAKAPTRERPKVGDTAHPTVKPLALMQWLVRLVTPPGGVVLEPFAGSGTTVEACLLEGFRCIAIEREADYLPLIEARIARQRKPDVPNAAEALALFDFEEPA